MTHRIEKVESLLKEELSLIMLYKLGDIGTTFLTITNVKVTPDLKLAKIYLSVFEKEKREAVLKLIEAKSGFIRHELASRITLKFVPELKFYIDDTMDYVEKIDSLLKKIHENDSKEPKGEE